MVKKMRLTAKQWTKLGTAFIFIMIYYAIVQFIYTIGYVAIQKGLQQDSVYFLCDILLFLPAPIVIWYCGLNHIKNSIRSEGTKYLVFYIAYIAVMYLIRKEVVLGVYYFEIFGVQQQLNKTEISAFLMAYLYMLFHSFKSTIFFILLPCYFWFFDYFFGISGLRQRKLRGVF